MRAKWGVTGSVVCGMLALLSIIDGARAADQPTPICTSCGDLKITVTKAAAATAGVADSNATSGVSIIDFAFPTSVSVTVGDTVTWTNTGNAIHTVTSLSAEVFASSDLSHNQTFSHTFSTMGSFNYHCTHHGQMTGTIVVNAVSSDATLSNLTVSGVPFSFSPATATYNLNVANTTSSVTVTPTVNNANATVKVNTTAVNSGSGLAVSLNVGPNPISVVVTAQDSSTNTYTLNVTRAQSSNADLSSLTLSAGTLNSAFTAGQQNYTATVAYTVAQITVTPTTADANAQVSVAGSGVTSGMPSGFIQLNPGDNPISVVVTAQNNTQKTYTVTVTRTQPNTNAALASLSMSPGTFTPAFASGTLAYTARFPNSVSSVMFTPATADATATVTVNGSAVASGNASVAIALNVGSNVIPIVGIAQDGSTKLNYSVTVTRVPLTNDASLAGLALSVGALSPAFVPATINYSLSVPFATTGIALAPTTNDLGATVTVNGTALASGVFSATLPLNVGSNALLTVVTSSDGSTTNTYTLTVTRAAPLNNAALAKLTLSAGSLTPAFDAATFSYTSSVINGTASLTVTATTADAGATVKVNGTAAVSGTVSNALPLVVGSNTITIVVTAQDGVATKTYTVITTRTTAVPGLPGSIVFTSVPSAAPNTASVGQTVVFSTAASSTSPLTYTWSYGDGAADVGTSVSHAFSPAKTYLVTVVVTSVEGGSLSASVSLVVNPLTGGVPGAGAGTLAGEIDSDGDGFSDIVELAAGSNPLDASSIPGGAATAPKPQSATKTVIKISKKQVLNLSGTLHIPQGFAALGKVAVVDIGGYTQKFTLDKNSGGKTGKDTFKAGIKSTKGAVGEQDVKFKVVLNAVPVTVSPSSNLLVVIGGTVFSK